MTPRVTIQIPTYNQDAVVGRAIESALSQDYPSIEVVVADDCSSDGTTSVVRRYAADGRLKYFRNSANLGRVGNYRHALYDLAGGQWAVNLDGDDYFSDSGFISTAMHEVARHHVRRIVMFQGGHVRKEVGAKNGRDCVDLPRISGTVRVMPGVEYFLKFQKIGHFSHLATVYRRDVAMEIGFYRADILSSDIESFLRLALHGDVILMRRAFGVWMQDCRNAGRNITVRQGIDNAAQFTSPYEYALAGGMVDPRTLRKWKRTMMRRHCLWLYGVALSRWECKDVARAIGVALRMDPTFPLCGMFVEVTVRGLMRRWGKRVASLRLCAS